MHACGDEVFTVIRGLINCPSERILAKGARIFHEQEDRKYWNIN
jgi:hypothetical protein